MTKVTITVPVAWTEMDMKGQVGNDHHCLAFVEVLLISGCTNNNLMVGSEDGESAESSVTEVGCLMHIRGHPLGQYWLELLGPGHLEEAADRWVWRASCFRSGTMWALLLKRLGDSQFLCHTFEHVNWVHMGQVELEIPPLTAAMPLTVECRMSQSVRLAWRARLRRLTVSTGPGNGGDQPPGKSARRVGVLPWNFIPALTELKVSSSVRVFSGHRLANKLEC